MNVAHNPFDMSQWLSAPAGQNPWQSMVQPFVPTDMEALAGQLGKLGGDLGVAIDPATVSRLQNDYMTEAAALWQDMMASRAPALQDRRFAASAWQENPFFAFNAAVYLLNGRFLTALADAIEAPPKVKSKIRFAVQQMIDAMSPSNFLATNPVAQQRVIDTQGQSLAKGVARMLEDMQKGRISQTDESAFEVGRNVATTPGDVIFENPFFQLIQYKPSTKTVHERPLLIVPPCINKFYILDLQPENSFVRYAVDQGHTVFLLSWRNPDESLANATWEQYVEDGVIKAIDVVRDVSKQDAINALGFCVGGTLLTTALAVMYARGEKPAASLTLLTTLLDFADPGSLDVYIDEQQIALREQQIGRGGLMPGRDFATAFSSLRPNDLVWNYVEANYLKGEEPPAFDLLYWNADSTGLPGPMFCTYLRKMYLENALREPGGLTIGGQKIDLGRIAAPAFVFASREDHIVPWTSAYASMGLLNPKKPKENRFVLGASGHIAGVINSPAKNKRSHWVNDATAADAQAWLDGSEEKKGSWWPLWVEFLNSHAGKQVPAPRKAGSARYKPIEPAPGRYVKARSTT